MASKLPEERSLIARIGGYTAAAQCADPVARTDAARAAAWQRFLDEVDPDGVLDPDERVRRALSARKAHLARATLASIQARCRQVEERRQSLRAYGDIR